MRKFKIFSILYILSTVYFSELSFAATDNTSTKWTENTNIILEYLNWDLLINILFAILTIIFTFLIAKFITSKLIRFLEWSYAGEESWREELVWVLSRTVNIAILSIWAAITLTILWVDMTIFLWGLWFGLGFTLKIFLTNFVAWILMVTQWFYHINDMIWVWNRVGRIRKIHALFTAIEQFDWVIFYSPNVTFLEQEIENYSTNDKRRVDISIWVDYDTDILKAKKIMMQVIENFPHVLKSPWADVIISDMWDSSINLSLRFWINSKDTFFTLKSNVTETVNLAFRQSGIIIPFPQMTLSNRDWSPIKMDK